VNNGRPCLAQKLIALGRTRGKEKKKQSEAAPPITEEKYNRCTQGRPTLFRFSGKKRAYRIGPGKQTSIENVDRHGVELAFPIYADPFAKKLKIKRWSFFSHFLPTQGFGFQCNAVQSAQGHTLLISVVLDHTSPTYYTS